MSRTILVFLAGMLCGGAAMLGAIAWALFSTIEPKEPRLTRTHVAPGVLDKFRLG